MALARTYAAVVIGVRAHLVEVEASMAAGLPGLVIIGRPDATLNESRDRVRAAIINSGLRWPNTRITVGLSPAWLPKKGSSLDIAIALAILAADGQIPADLISRAVGFGELGLDGRIRPVAGALSAALAVREGLGENLTGQMISGPDDAGQLAVVPGIETISAVTLRALAARLRGEQEPDLDQISPVVRVGPAPGHGPAQRGADLDLRDVKGQSLAKFAVEVAAAGGHHLALLGRAGVGKTLLAERLPGLLPDLDDDASLDVTSIHQLSGWSGAGLVTRPPWCAPHHTASRPAMVGGGTDDRPTIGMVSLAHRGVLFLDEAAEFDPTTLDALREPLESGAVSIARAGFRVVYPARFQLVLASNPCPCGNAMDAHRGAVCSCTPHQRRRYLGRLSGPLLDRIDVRVVLTRPTLSELQGMRSVGDSSVDVAARVALARERAAHRLRGTQWDCLAQVPPVQLLSLWSLPADSVRELDGACSRDTVRGRDRVVRVAWSIADLAGHGAPSPADVRAALELRSSHQEWAA
ncbi:MAG: YifB family Mg chelatase-like AAA ATPase [Actinomycetes bacterium]